MVRICCVSNNKKLHKKKFIQSLKVCYTYEKATINSYVRKIYVMMNNAPLFTWLRLLMLAILIEILTEIPLQKQHIMRQLKTQNTDKIQYIKDNIKDAKFASY